MIADLRILHRFRGAKSSKRHFLPFLRLAPMVHPQGWGKGSGDGGPTMNPYWDLNLAGFVGADIDGSPLNAWLTIDILRASLRQALAFIDGRRGFLQVQVRQIQAGEKRV